MNQIQDTIKHVKGKHLNFAQRVFIQIRTEDGWSPYRIAKELGCSSNTVRNEIKRGTPELYWGDRPAYDARHGQANYENQRINSHRTPNLLKVRKFLKTVEVRFREEHWSLDACVGYSRINREFARHEMVCTKTLYNYVERGILEIKNIAVAPTEQRKGYGKTLIAFLARRYAGSHSVLQVGTGESPLTIPFYEKCGFVRSHRVPNFFTDNYDHPIYEGGVKLVDMVYLRRHLHTSAAPAFCSSSDNR